MPYKVSKMQKMKANYIFKKCNIYINDVLKNRENFNFKESCSNFELNKDGFCGYDTLFSPDNLESEPGIDYDNIYHNELGNMMNESNHLNLIFNKELKELDQLKNQNNKNNIISIEYPNTSKSYINQIKIRDNKKNDFNIKYMFRKINKNNNIKKLKGRKKKGDKEEREHTKFSEDNEMRKIKTYFNHFIHNYVNSSLSPGHNKLLKINTTTNEKLTKDLNVNLMNLKLKDIFCQYSVNRKNLKFKDGNKYNSDLIKDIYENNIEKKAIERLNLSYIEVLDIMRKYYLEVFKNDIFDKEIRNGEKTAKKYVKELVDLLFEFEIWFNNKASRKPKKLNKI